MIPSCLRGQAYLQLHQGKEAAAEFQKILDHSGFVLNMPTGALARLGLARAYALQGDTAKAKAAYGTSSPSGKTPTRHPDLPASQSRVRKAAVANFGSPALQLVLTDRKWWLPKFTPSGYFRKLTTPTSPCQPITVGRFPRKDAVRLRRLYD